MAYEVTSGPLTLVSSTGITRHRFVAFTSGKVTYPAVGALATMVTVSKGTTGSTEDGQFVSCIPLSNCSAVMVEAAGSTLSAGDLVSASSRGKIVAGSSDVWILGQIISGSSGSTGRILTIVPISGSPSTGV